MAQTKDGQARFPIPLNVTDNTEKRLVRDRMTTSAPRAGTLADLLTAEALVFPPKDHTPFDWLDERVNSTREHAAALASLINWLDQQEKELAVQLTADLTPDDVATRRPYNFGPD